MASKHKSDEKVQVNVRCRPMNQSERQRRIKKVVECNSKTKEVTISSSMSSTGLSGSHQTKSYSFDKVFGPNATQIEVYKSVVECQLQDVLAGYNCTVLAYGQTGTGKTYTMEGERSVGEEYSWDTDPRAGIIPRTLSQLFDCLEKAGCEFSVRVSLLEIYNEEIYDLLSPSSDMRKMKIYEDNTKKGSVVVSGLTEVHVRHKSDVYHILQQGATKRRTAATNLNEFSSRSHSVFSVTVHSKDITHNNMEEEELVKIGKLNLVDLAGSENIGRSGAVDKHAREAGNINQSLLTLGRCITALVDRTPHIPYRESKLTRLLQDSLGGATKTSMIATVSPGSDNFDETMSTLEYAARAKNIHNKPRVNQRLTKRALIKEYDDEIERLRREVVAMREKNGVYVDPQRYDEMIHEIESLTTSAKQSQEEASEFKRLFTDASNDLDSRTEELRLVQDDLFDLRKEFAELCFLKDAHVEHGQEVTKFASDVLATTSDVTNDIVQVHNKVDRVKQVHENNVNSFRSFSEGIKSDVDFLRTEAISVLNESRANVKETQNNLASYRQSSDAALSKMVSFVEEFRDVARVNHRSTGKLLTSWSESLDECATQHNRTVSTHETSMFEQCDRFREKFSQLDEIAESWLQIMKSFKEFSSLYCQKMESEVRLAAEQTKEVERKVDNMNSSLDELLDKQREDCKFTMEMCGNIMSCMTKMQQRTEAQRDVRKEASSSLLSAASSYEKEMSERRDRQKSEMNQRGNKLMNLMENCGETMKTFTATLNEEVAETKESCENHSAEMQSIFKTVKEGGTSLVNECEQQFESSNDSAHRIKEQCHVTIDTLRQASVEHVETVAENASALDEDLESIESILEEGNKKVVKCAEQYARDKVERIVPTGTTPARKAYEYSRKIPPAPIDEEILTNFRERLLESSQDEDEENPLEERINEDDDETMTSLTSQNESEQSKEQALDESITIPDVGGIPFFKRTTRSRAKLHPAAVKKSQSRIPLKPVHNANNNHRSDKL